MLPILLWYGIVRVAFRHEVLGKVWDLIPARNQSWVLTLLRLPERRLPYRWRYGTAEEQLLRYCLKAYFEADSRSGGAPGQQALVRRLLFWFAAPAYLSLTTLYLQALVLAFADPLPLTPSAQGLFAAVLVSWFLLSYGYYWLQSRRISEHLDVHPEGNGGYIPGVFQGAASSAPSQLRERSVQVGVPAALSFIAAISFPLLSGLLPHPQ